MPELHQHNASSNVTNQFKTYSTSLLSLYYQNQVNTFATGVRIYRTLKLG